MANTGYKIYQNLEEYNVDTGVATGNVKPNVETDPDYIAPIYDTVFCPLPSGTETETGTTSIYFTGGTIVDSSSGNTASKKSTNSVTTEPVLSAGGTYSLDYNIELSLYGDYNVGGTVQAEAKAVITKNGVIQRTMLFSKADMTTSSEIRTFTGNISAVAGDNVEIVFEAVATAETPYVMSAKSEGTFPTGTINGVAADSLPSIVTVLSSAS